MIKRIICRFQDKNNVRESPTNSVNNICRFYIHKGGWDGSTLSYSYQLFHGQRDERLAIFVARHQNTTLKTELIFNHYAQYKEEIERTTG